MMPGRNDYNASKGLNETTKKVEIWWLRRSPPSSHNSSQEEDRTSYWLKLISAENFYVGMLLGSKAIAQLVANAFVGPLTNKYANIGGVLWISSGCIKIGRLLFVQNTWFKCRMRHRQKAGFACLFLIQSYLMLRYQDNNNFLGKVCTKTIGSGRFFGINFLGGQGNWY